MADGGSADAKESGGENGFVRSVDSGSDILFDYICTSVCASTNKKSEAVKYCVDCQGFLCVSCVHIHGSIPVLKGHNLVECSEIDELGISPGSSGTGPVSATEVTSETQLTETCSVHPTEIVDKYCGTHDNVGCVTCMSCDHSSCTNVYLIPDDIKTLYKNVEVDQTKAEVKISKANVSENEEMLVRKLDEARQKDENDLEAFTERMKGALDRFKQETRLKIAARHKEKKDKKLEENENDKEVLKAVEALADKLKSAEGNKAQEFVYMKLVQVKMKELKAKEQVKKGGAKIEEESHDLTSVFIEYIKNVEATPKNDDETAVKAIQENEETAVKAIQENEETAVKAIQENEETAVKTQSDINRLYTVGKHVLLNVKVPSNVSSCCIQGSCFTKDGDLLIVDSNNHKLKRVNLTKKAVVDHWTVHDPEDVCCVSENIAVVACYSKSIEFISFDRKISPTRVVSVDHFCCGIASNGKKLFVSDWNKAVFVYDLNGTKLQTIRADSTGLDLFRETRKLAFDANKRLLYVCDSEAEHGVIILDEDGNLINRMAADGVHGTYAICADRRGNILVGGHWSLNVVQLRACGTKVGEIIKQTSNLYAPRSLCFDDRTNTLVVTSKRDEVELLELR